MPELQEICPSEFFRLTMEIETYLNAQDVAERAYSEGSADYEGLQDEALLKAHKMKARIRSLAIALGIHREFLTSYDSLRVSMAKQVIQPQADLAEF